MCKILDFGKYKYELAKKEKANRAKHKVAEVKEVRLGRSMKIDPHDVEIRLQQARRFLLEGHKVQIVQNFRGREMQHRDRGNIRMKEIIDKLSDIGKVELAPRLNGKRMSMMIGPDKAKIDAVLKRQAAAAQKSTPDGVASTEKAPSAAAPTVPPTATPAAPQAAKSGGAKPVVQPAKSAVSRTAATATS